MFVSRLELQVRTPCASLNVKKDFGFVLRPAIPVAHDSPQNPQCGNLAVMRD
jgi:hypothetical protein